jgi:DeoR family transcriptional regulator, fructose operon transcriptional repressor
MLGEERRTRVLEIVRDLQFASLPQLVEHLGVSESTIRRDLELLEEQGVTRRIHGGVLYVGSPVNGMPTEDREPAHWNLKQAIAKTAATLVEDGDTILLDGGSTTYEVARRLVGRPLHVVTNSLPVANLFASCPISDLVLIGGNVCTRTGVVRGPYADEMLAKIRVRKTILSTAAVCEEGFFNNNMLLIETERAMMRAGKEVIVVADSSKFGNQSLAHVCGLGTVDHVVVDSQLSDEWQAKLISAGVNLLVAEVGEPVALA